MKKKLSKNCVKSMKSFRYAKKFHEMLGSVESFVYLCR